MKARENRCNTNMPCESCAVQFSVFRRKRACCECERYFCSGCLRRGGGVMCAACRLLSTRPLSRQAIAHLKVRDLQCFLQRQNVSTRGCVEKEELVSLCVGHVNSAAYRRRGARAPGPFSTLKDFTKLINNAFDLRAPAQPAPPPPNSNCYNAAHTHEPAPAPSPARERFTTTPGGERDIEVPVPAGVSRSTSGSSGARRDTADCFEIEDLDDAGWEFVTRPADPLPNDSEVLITENEMHTPAHEPDRTTTVRVEVHAPGVSAHSPREGAGLGVGAGPGAGAGRLQPERAGATPQRAASELELRRDPPPDSDTTSLQDEPMMDRPPAGDAAARVAGRAAVGGGAGGAERAPAEGAAGAQPRGLHRLPRARRPAAARAAAVARPRRLQGRDRQPAAGGVLQDLHVGAAGVRAAGVRAHRGLHAVRRAPGRVPHLPPVRRARRALLPLLSRTVASSQDSRCTS